MPDNLPQALTCPTCGASLEFDGKSSIIRCNFCHNVSIVPGILPEKVADPKQVMADIRNLVASGDMLQAMKKYRDAFGVSLREANDAVDAIQAGRMVDLGNVLVGTHAPGALGNLVEDVQEILKTGNKIEAIKRYRELRDVSLAKAKYAVEQIESGNLTFPEGGFNERVEVTLPAGVAKKKSNAGCIMGIAIALFAGGIVVFGMSLPGGPLNQKYYSAGEVSLSAPGAGITPEIASALYDPNKDERFIGLVDTATGKLFWKADALPGDGFAQGIFHAGERVYAASGTDLLAYHASDGSLAWQAVMPDKLSYSDNNLLVMNGMVITLNVDQSIQAYDAVTGAPAWSRRLKGYEDTLRLVKGSLVVLDTVEQEYVYSMVFLDPQTGAEQRILTPSCQYSEYSAETVDPGTGMVFDEAGDALYLVYDSSTGCLQRLGLSSGQLVWQTLDDESYSFSPYGVFPLLTGDRVYFSLGNRLMSVDKASGTLKEWLAGEDYEFLPLAATDAQLLVRARRTRGSEHFELWMLDLSSGEVAWQKDMGNVKPVDPPNEMSGLIDKEDKGYTWHLLPDGLAVVRFEAEPNQAVVEMFNLSDGTLQSQTVLRLKKVSGDFYSIPSVLGWRDAVIYLEVDGNFYAIDVLSGKILFDY